MTYLISFRVADPAKRAQLIQRVKTLGAWMVPIDGVVLLDTTYLVGQLQNDLAARIAQTDALLILQVYPQVSGGYLDPQAWAWLKSRYE